jgi:hypothetical protein
MANINFSLPDEGKKELEAAYQKAIENLDFKVSFSAWLWGRLKKALKLGAE